MNKKIRWKQRFENFEKAFQKLEQAVAQKKYSEIERAGLIQFFEFTFELSWKTLKDYLESVGFTLTTPRDVFKQAFQMGFLEDGHEWMQALEDRNLTAHTYDEATSKKIEKLITDKYFLMIKKLYQRFLKEFSL